MDPIYRNRMTWSKAPRSELADTTEKISLQDRYPLTQQIFILPENEIRHIGLPPRIIKMQGMGSKISSSACPAAILTAFDSSQMLFITGRI